MKYIDEAGNIQKTEPMRSASMEELDEFGKTEKEVYMCCL